MEIPAGSQHATVQPESHVEAPSSRYQQQGGIREEKHQFSDLENYAVSFAAVRGFIEDLGFFVKYRLSAMYNRNCDTLFQLSAAALLGLVDSISAFFEERNEDNKSYIDAAHSVLPHARREL